MKSIYTNDSLSSVISESDCWADACRKLGIKPSTGSQSYLKKRVEQLNISFTHFVGQGWRRGRKFQPRRDISVYLIKSDKPIIKSNELKRRLLKEGLFPQKCGVCNITEWNGEDIPLELDHINRDHLDNRIENLQIICPNCHAQKTSRDRKSNSRRYTPMEEGEGSNPF